MPSATKLFYTLISLAPLAVRAGLELDQDDISPACQSICRPVRELSQLCDVDGDEVGGDLAADNLTLQCLCLNNSFDVGTITPLCQSCIQQNPVPDDDGPDPLKDLEDIDEIVSRCNFTQAAFTPDKATLADGIVVAAAQPTGANQPPTTTTAGNGQGPARPVSGSTLPTAAAAAAAAVAAPTNKTPVGISTNGEDAESTPTGVTVSGATAAAAFTGGWTMMLTAVCAVGFGRLMF